jgi:hypothetical protein
MYMPRALLEVIIESAHMNGIFTNKPSQELFHVATSPRADTSMTSKVL